MSEVRGTSVLKEVKEKVYTPITKRMATRGKRISIDREVKRYASTLRTKEERREYLNFMLDAQSTQRESIENRKRARDEE